MNKYISFALVLFASVALSSCSSYGVPLPPLPPPTPYGGPAVQQVALSSIPGLSLEQILGGASTHDASQYNAALRYAPLKSIVLPAPAPQPSYSNVAAPSVSSYGSAPLPALPALPAGYAVLPAVPSSYGAAPSVGYGAPAPKASVQPAYATQLYPGQQNYKTIQSPPQYNTVALPIVSSDPVAKLYLPQQSSYGSPSLPAPPSPLRY